MDLDSSASAASSTPSWTVHASSPDSNAASFAAGLQAILNRMQTLSILREVLYIPLTTLLALLITLALLRRQRVVGFRVTWVDILAFAAWVGAVHVRDMVSAVCVAGAWGSWSVCVDGGWSFAESRVEGWDGFVGGLKAVGDGKGSRPGESSKAGEIATTSSEGKTADEGEENEEQEEPTCLICWSATPPPLLLPCAHTVCRECLSRLKTSLKPSCPLCSRPLFRTQAPQAYIFQLLIATSGALVALTLTLIGLKIWKAHYISAAMSAITILHPWGWKLLWGQGTSREMPIFMTGLRERTLVLAVLVTGLNLWYVAQQVPEVDFVVFFDGEVRRFWGTERQMSSWEVVWEWVMGVDGLIDGGVRFWVSLGF